MYAQARVSPLPTVEIDGASVPFHRSRDGWIVRTADLTRAIFSHRSASYRHKLRDLGATPFVAQGLPKSMPSEPDPWCVSLSDVRTILSRLTCAGVRIDWQDRAQLMLVAMQMTPELAPVPAPQKDAPAITASDPQPSSATLEQCHALARRLCTAPPEIRDLTIGLISLRDQAAADLIARHVNQSRGVLRRLIARVMA